MVDAVKGTLFDRAEVPEAAPDSSQRPCDTPFTVAVSLASGWTIIIGIEIVRGTG